MGYKTGNASERKLKKKGDAMQWPVFIKINHLEP